VTVIRVLGQAERDRIFAEMEQLRAERFGRLPRAPGFFRQEAEPVPEKPEQAQPKQAPTEKQMDAVRSRLKKVLERLESQEATEANLAEIQRVERILESLERDLEIE
jgi:hypothetical protein